MDENYIIQVRRDGVWKQCNKAITLEEAMDSVLLIHSQDDPTITDIRVLEVCYSTPTVTGIQRALSGNTA